MTVYEIICIIADFIDKYWRLLCILGFIISLIISLIIARKKPSKVTVNTVDSIWSSILTNLPKIIRRAEDCTPGEKQGELKKEVVFDTAIHLAMAIGSLSFDEAVSRYGKLIDAAIENILMTPQKKE